ncbi:peptidoglycan-associated lipoprotein Pal [Actimicrobium sp. CCI2.3]|uniref:peptidoglycan-associated lipoprotein Pal n=1 Tax=Actimicrobium sp. CCI2.3 TaxID=3048616 RepID=UPI002AB3F2F5|nr:peptidoglycan-associated lipoprotein Pal [Actimicrobium sp. CCI2.3]MDY7576027.1 peptidoglycan-associated lipoprotein Pal [Actimicrobium sp. CCI2.3]MEB0022957.1 peptidoglycan-associated lipoprotein Pal [Actimicrobium sp. CCI2.3]
MRNLSTFAIVAASVLLFSACSSTKLDEKPPVEDRSGSTAMAAPVDTRAVNPVNAGSTDPLNDPQGVLAKRSVYFDYDSYVVKDEFKSVLNAHARYLNANKSRKIIIQGNTDDRGGREYNLALGQKRSEAVRQAMSLMGVSESQLEAVSLGKEKPKATGTDEASFAENRRADIVY